MKLGILPRLQTALSKGALKVALATGLVILPQFTEVIEAWASPRFSTIAVDARTGKIITGIDFDGLRHPASLTKMMTLYIVFQELNAGRIQLDTPLTVSKRASTMAPSKLGLKPGSKIAVIDAVKALVTKSANDIATTIAENLGGSEASFATRMTSTARQLGMSRTTFLNASGLPNPNQWTTARDMATLGLRLQRDFPQYYPYFNAKSFSYRGVAYKNHNKLLGRFRGADGIKTGYTAASGFNLTASAKRGDKRIVAVVLGATSGAARDAYIMRLMEKTLPLCVNGKTISALSGSSAGAKQIEEQNAEPSEKPAQTSPTQTPSAQAPQNQQLVEKAPPKQPNSNKAPLSETVQTHPEETRVLEAKIANAAKEPTIIKAEAQVTPPLKEIKPAEVETKTLSPPPPAKLPFAIKNPADNAPGVLVNDQAEIVGAPAQAATTVATISPPSSWTIQVGTYKKKEEARQQLQSMRTSGYKFLKNKTALMLEIESSGTITYRARFSGFNEKSASEACRNLAKKGYECQPISPQS